MMSSVRSGGCLIQIRPHLSAVSRNGRHYSLTVVYVDEFEYVNIYAVDITNFIIKVNQIVFKYGKLLPLAARIIFN